MCLKWVYLGQTPQRRDFGYPRFLASTSPHERIVERYREEHQHDSSDDASDADGDSEFAELSKRSTSSTSLSVMRSASMNDLANDSATGAGAALGASSDADLNPLHRAVSVETSLNGSHVKENKENFAIPQPVAVASASAAQKKREMKQPAVSGRKILNAQNTKAQ